MRCPNCMKELIQIKDHWSGQLIGEVACNNEWCKYYGIRRVMMSKNKSVKKPFFKRLIEAGKE